MSAGAGFLAELRDELRAIDEAGLRKVERPLTGPQATRVGVGAASMLNFCSNNYLGLADRPEVVAKAKAALDYWGFGMASVRFISGTQEIHLQLESELSSLLGSEDTILFPSCFDANGAIFDVLLDERDAVISDALNHASIIDGIRLSKARRLRFRNRDLEDLETQLRATTDARRRLIVTDGVFSMDGYFAPLAEICDLAERYDALVMVDDSHATGFVGATGAGTPELHGVRERVDILTGTLGKALGGASGGYASARRDIVDVLRQRSRPYLFSNAVPPSAVGGALAALEIVRSEPESRERLRRRAEAFRAGMTAAGFRMLDGSHPIVPVMFEDERAAVRMAQELFERGVYVTAFSYPVVPLGQARIRVQLSAAHDDDDVAFCVDAFIGAREAVA